MNWGDYVVIGIIALFAIIGLIKGFIYSAFKIGAFFVSIVISMKFYPLVSDVLSKTVLYSNIKASILKSLLVKNQAAIPVAGSQTGGGAEAVVNQLALPDFFKQFLTDKLPKPDGIINVSGIMNSVSEELTKIVISIISLIVLYVLVRIGLVLVGFLLRGIAKMPVIKQIDKLGGFVLGTAEGALTVYILFAVLLLFNASPQFKSIFEAVDNSLIAKVFYQNNFIISWMFPAG